jgi:UPF0716 family protein affecting phage T7 exclusion
MAVAAALLMIKPGLVTDAIGFMLLAIILAWNYMQSRGRGDSARLGRSQ